VVLPIRIVSEGFNMEPANYNIAICKIEIFAFYTIRTISCWLIVLACIDRYLHSSMNQRIRQMSSLKTTRIIIGVTIIVITVLYSHMIVFYEITYTPDQFGNITPGCYGQKGIYRTFIASWYMVLYSLCPSLLMFIFGLLTLNNIHQRRKIVPLIHETSQRVQRTNTHLLRMLLAQVLVTIISTLPFGIYRLYGSFTVNLIKDTLRRAQENLTFQVASTMTYFAHTSSFYLYTLAGSVFRKELIKIIGRCFGMNRNIFSTHQTETLEMLVLSPIGNSGLFPHNKKSVLFRCK
jgi:hypothetical protein